MLTKLAIWYLRKRKVSVMMNFYVDDATIVQKSIEGYLYDNSLIDCDYLSSSEKRLILPEGKFHIVD